MKQKGASYTASLIRLAQGGRYFRPTCIAAAKHESSATKHVWYLTDWVDGSYNVHGFGRIWKLEIEIDKASWLALWNSHSPLKKPDSPDNCATRHPALSLDVALDLARHEDPFIARAALVRVSRMIDRHGPKSVLGWKPADRVTAVRALQIAGADPQPWIERALNDRHQPVQFEALRWISDASLLDERFKQFLPKVELLLKRPELSFELFEAGIATLNSLQGNPHLGLSNPELLIARVQDGKSPPQLRAYALRLLPVMQRSASGKGLVRFPKGLTVQLLAGLLDLGSDELAMEALRALGGHPTAGKHVLARFAGDEKRPTELRAEAIAGLAGVAGEYVDQLVAWTGSGEASIAEEALRALRGQSLTAEQFATIKQAKRRDLVAALLDPASLARSRPDPANLRVWLQRLDAIDSTPNPDSGRRIFHHATVALCSRCHRHGGRGKIVGPDLTHTGRQKDGEWFLKAILQPSADMAPEYQPRELTLTNGDTHTGIRLRSYSREQLRDINGNTITFHKDQVAGIRDLNVSLMPEGLAHGLTDRELRDLLAFLTRSDSK